MLGQAEKSEVFESGAFQLPKQDALIWQERHREKWRNSTPDLASSEIQILKMQNSLL